MGLDRLAWRTLAARPLRTALTIIGVALGVGIFSASLTMGAGLDSAIDRTVSDVVGKSDLRVSAFLERGLSPGTVDLITGTEGVAVVAPILERQTFVEPVLGGPLGGAVTAVGVDPASYARLHPLEVVAGRALERPDELSAIVTQSLANSDGFALGGTVNVLGHDGPVALQIVGILAGPGPAIGTGGRTIIVPLDVAQSTFAVDGVTRVDLGLSPGATAATVGAALKQLLTSEPYVFSSPSDLAAGLRASTADFQATTALIAAIVLFVGSLLIINTLSMTVGERAREVGLLRAAGATRGQVVQFVLVGAAILGLIGSMVGLFLGAGLGGIMAGSIRALTGFTASVSGLDARSLAIAFLVGLGVTVAAAIEPALRAARISPVDALRVHADLPAARRGHLGWLAVVFIMVAFIALAVWPPAAGSVGAERAVAVYGALLVATLLSPFLLPPMARVLGVPLGRVVRLEERLARGSLGRDRNRSALTLGALVIGLAMIVALGWTAQAARERATAWLASVVPGDELVSSIRPVPSDEGVVDELAGVPGVARVSPIATFDLAISGFRVDAAAIVGADFLADERLTFVAGDRTTALRALDAGGATVLPVAAAARLGVHMGDNLIVPLGSGGTLDLRVVGIVERSIPSGGGEAILVGWGDATNAIGVAGADVFAVRFGPDAGSAARSALKAKADLLGLQANPLTVIQGAVSDALGRVFGLFDALALVAVLVAALGVVNTLTMGVVERVREIGVLRSIGMTRRQASRMLVVEASLLGLVGIILGALVGLAVGAILLALTGGFVPGIGFPWAPIGIAAVIGVASSMVAAYYPSRLASGVSIIAALKFE